jgi:hypothetical protein
MIRIEHDPPSDEPATCACGAPVDEVGSYCSTACQDAHLATLAEEVEAMPRGTARARTRARLRARGWQFGRCACGAPALTGSPLCGICFRKRETS